MRKFEFEIVAVKGSERDELVQTLNQKGQAGWRVVANLSGPGHCYEILLQREKQE